MKKVLILAAVLAVFYGVVFGEGFQQYAQAEAEGISEEIWFMKIPEVVTASKAKESINKAPAIVYVVTREEIKLSGARSLAEILKRVPGMRISVRETSLLGSRGFTSDQNDKFLFLVDGTPITNIMQDGTYNFIDMPNLSMVEKIEVVKGPASTLWGSDATFGIINIITKNGSDIEGVKVSADYSAGNNQATGNILAGRKIEAGSYLFSLTYTESGGYSFGAAQNEGNTVYQWGNEKDIIQSGFVNPPLTENMGARILDYSPSFELYSKLSLGNYTLKGRVSYMAQKYLWNTNYEYKMTDAAMKHMYLEAERSDNFGDNISLATKVNAHGLEYERGLPVSYVKGVTWVAADIETMAEMGFSAESMLSASVADIHRIVTGVKFSRINIGPDTRIEYLPDMSDSGNIGYLYVITLKPAIDNTIGVYLEDNIDVTDRLSLVGGLSYEYNDLREIGGNIMPRAAVILQATDEISAKYAYNTGYGRPPAQKKFGRYFGHAQKSEKIQEHDVQLMFNNKLINVGFTGFNYYIMDYLTWYDDGTEDPVTHVHMNAGHYNKGVAISNGIELSARGNLSRDLSLYGNYMYAETEINGGIPVGEPKHVYNIGADWYVTRDISANLNVNGFVDMYHGKSADERDLYWSGWQEQMVDLTVVAENILDRFSVTVYGTNLLNNKVHVGMTGYPGYTYLGGLSIGGRISASF
ncbi:MAG TPA: TonB-dependent receptor [Candidatus Goldiibacteriota bacterium]|nr:TonB-dependent receptor [Candidatus Goldiibacteriota bacterium]HRQ44939.1 TonB-dependent receptor [Candidatus Goldiibacteriota bacterium]